MKKFLFFLISFVLGASLFIWTLNHVGWSEIKEAFLGFSFLYCLVILVLTVLIWLVGSWIWFFTLREEGSSCSFKVLLRIFFSSNAITYLLTPTALLGGEGFRLYALRKKFDLPWDKNLAVLIIEKLLSASVVLFFLIAGFFSFLFLNQNLSKNLIIISAGIIITLVISLLIFYLKCFKKESIFKLIYRFFGKKVKNGNIAEEVETKVYHFFEPKRKVMWQGIGLTFLRYFLVFLRCWFLIYFLKGETSILIALAIMFFLYLAYSFPLPAGLGSLEAIQAFAFSSLFFDSSSGVTFSFILRGSETIISLLGLGVLIKLGIEIFSNDISKFFKKFKLNGQSRN